MKKIVETIYILLLLVMAFATIAGKLWGNDFALSNIYGSWWFCLLWAMGVAAGVVYFVRQRVCRPFAIVLHASFVVILAGALTTYITSRRGMIHLRQGSSTTFYVADDGSRHGLPFSIRLRKFVMPMHAGNEMAMDFRSEVEITRGNAVEKKQISMNNIYDRYGVRLYQSSYDEDLQGTYLSVNADPYGIPVTYVGYALLFISLLWMLVDRQGTFRKLLRSEVLRRPMAVLLLLIAFAGGLRAQRVLPETTAEKFGNLFVVYNGRICPMQTLAIDFTKKLYGKARYKNFNACQVLSGFVFFPADWVYEPIVKVKGKELQDRLKLSEYISVSQLFSGGNYVLGPYLSTAMEQEQGGGIGKQILDTDDKVMLVMNVSRGEALKMFPYLPVSGSVEWFSPVENLPSSMPKEQQMYIRTILSMAVQAASEGKNGVVDEIFDKLLKYQYRYGGATIPSKAAVIAERINNKIPFATILFMVNITLGFLSVAFVSRQKHYRWFTLLMALSCIVLLFNIVLRWIISSSVPIGNGYETMLLMAFLIMVVAFCTTKRVPIMTTFGLLMSGFMLLVSHIGQMDPAITHRMPVLNSPLLSIHVSIIMMAYALLSLTFIISVAYFLISWWKKKCLENLQKQLTVMSQIFLYPAMTAMGLGIFIGAIWANISWGTYWGWDPKETWALITFMIYAVALHSGSIPALKRARNYHLFMFLAFLSILMTYFGVNYILGGMHSYA